jgi:hypothetical protein
MSREKLLELVAPLSLEERRELYQLLEEAPQALDEVDLENDPMLKVVRDLERLPPMDAPKDFSTNHDFYLHGGSKRES